MASPPGHLDVAEHRLQVVGAGTERQVVQDVRRHLPHVRVQVDDGGLVPGEARRTVLIKTGPRRERWCSRYPH